MRKNKILLKSLAVAASIALSGIIGMDALAPIPSASAAAANDYVSQYRADASDAYDALKKADKINQQIVEEGVVLLKNDNKTLPLKPGSKISVFGKNSTNPFFGGGGSASGSDGSGQGGVKSYDLIDGLANAGYEVNPQLVSFYNNNSQSGTGRDGGSGTGQVATRTGETPVSSYGNALRASFADYNDAAIIVIARAGGEGNDLRTNYSSGTAGRSNYNNNRNAATGDHYLELDDNEKDMIAMVKQNFKKIAILLNTGTSFELADLKEDDAIGAILWIGYPGGSGFYSVGKILNGEANPSGRLVDIYSKDFKKDPTFANFATNYTSAYTNQSGQNSGINFVEYDEGIYIGYRYYETRGYVEDDDCAWYDDNVVYPFGYGMSYTTFTKKVTFLTNELTATGDIKAQVVVTNTGDYAGKEVVEMYYTAPYIDNEIEKSHIVLGAFEKTNLLQPGESQTLTVSMKVRDMASYDYNDANANGFTGYELDAGEYTVYVGENSHVWADASAAKKEYTLADGITYSTDGATGAEVKNRFDYVSAYFDENATGNWSGHSSVMSRTDFEGTFPQPPTAAEATVTPAEQSSAAFNTAVPASYDQDKPWYTNEMPTYQTTRQTKISATRLVGLKYNDKRWDSFMDQLTLNDMAGLVMHGYFATDALANVDVPQSITPDGPTGFVQGSGSNWVGNTCVYASPIVVSSTWNKELANEMGKAVGDESIFGGDEGVWNGSSRYGNVEGGYNGWYAPGNNIHRSPFSGRNFEYYSEDPLLAGTICANVVNGAQSKGVFVMMKHFALNDQETNRANLATWATEQTMREIYLKSFEIAVKDGGATGMMSAFNRIGYAWAGFSYSLLTEVLRDEWGFNGVVITDWVNGYMRADYMVRAGNDLWLANNANISNLTNGNLTATHVAAIRRAAKSVLYAVVNSNAMNRLGARYNDEHYTGNNHRVNLSTVEKGGSVSYNAASTVFKGYKYVLTGAPKGITIDENTGVISGTVSQDAAAGQYLMSVSLKDDGGFIGQDIILSLTVNGGLTYMGEKQAKVTVGKFNRVDVSSELNGSNVTYSVEGDLPAGMALGADGYILGTPEQEGETTFTVVARTANQADLRTEVTLNAANPVNISYTGGALADATADAAYTADLATASGAQNITYAASDLPAGLTLSADGKLTGVPAQAGEYTIAVTASAADAEPVTAQFTLKVAAKPVQPEQSTAPAQSTEPAQSTAPAQSNQPASQSEESGGCFGTIGLGGGLTVLAGLGLSVIALRKRKEDNE